MPLLETDQLFDDVLKMTDEMLRIAAKAEQEAASIDLVSGPVSCLERAARDMNAAWSGSPLGYHANVYTEDLGPPKLGDRFTPEWGFDGRSPLWRELKDFIQDRLKLQFDEFNRVAPAGVANTARLEEMLDSAAFAFLVMTAEDELTSGTFQPRMNVVHEAGLFQGRLGFEKAIVLLEEGCSDFSNIDGLGQIRFPKGNIKAAFEDVRKVLEREGVIKAP